MRKNPYGRILKEESKEQHLSTVPKFYSNLNTVDSHFYILLTF